MNRSQQLISSRALKSDEGIIIHKPANIFYLSGFTGEGLLIIAKGMLGIVTDFRYVEQAQQQAPDYSVHSISNDVNHAQVAANMIKGNGIKKILFEDDYVTVKSYERLRDALQPVLLEPLNSAPEAMRTIKDKDEIAAIEKACAISCEAFDFVCGVIKPGMTEKVIKCSLDFRMLELGCDRIGFDSIVASGPNGSLPHAIAGDRKIQPGDMITLDFGAKYKGYCADMTRTVAVGQPGDLMKTIYGIVQKAQEASENALAPGKICRDIDAIARGMITDAGYGERFGHGLGHSLGIDIHEDPRLNPKSQEELKPGHVITVEPGIYLPGVGGVRIENTCLITASGARSLVSSPRDLIIL